ncbi:TetR/AcrR family transcriptional regulator [Limnohabitans sp.]|jgi:TetR/AcrR family transcriptional regulator|uniref:TetR/AcrR family transcriptional regulator n=1 Tax=Limnohabitans sp. TaxID=1907725 RepID=UPI001B7A9942|nr:TetR/AcrR family transcriptional regulator [Limnohabitans sp.]MBP6220864.1 TetR/AcrR family transcriptional regulator [Limnohabitans sp.]MBP6244752.1 TetR/AcrR family transcriptional regulator [Limnohabitans sp.]
MPSHTKQKTEDRQLALVAAALQLAAQKSPAQITTGALAAAVGITQGAVFKHFESKEAIWLAVMQWVHAELMTQLQAAAQAPLDQGQTLAAMRAVFMAHVQFVQAQPGVPRLVFQELQHPQPSPLKASVQQLMVNYRQLVHGLLLQAQARKQLAKNMDLNAATVLFVGAIQGLVMQALMAGHLSDIAEQATTVYDIYEQGLVQPMPSSTRTKA